MNQNLDALIRKIQNRKARLGVIGLGYVGLPLAVEFAKAGFRTTGIDVDAGRVKQLKAGRSYITDIANSELAGLVRKGLLSGTTRTDVLKALDAVVICVPTPLRKSRDPDISYIVSAAEALAKHLHRHQVIVLESTTYPGTTREVILPMLQATGLKVGRDFFLGFSPERIDPGNRHYGTRTIPKVISGVTPACRKAVSLLYGEIIQKLVPVSSTDVAEMVKLLENTFRSVNIGLVNELALMCHRLGVDVWEVIEAAASKPFGFMPFYPGPGLGGHCLDGKETVVVRQGNQVDTLNLEELVSQLRAEGDCKVVSHQGALFLRPKGLTILSFDPVGKKSCFQPVQWIGVRPYSGPMISLRTRDGRQLTVTDRHPMVVHDGLLKIKLANEVKEGDRIPTVQSMPNKTFARHPGYSTVEVKELTRLNGTRSVYSVEVANTHTFVTSYGWVVHNCIPIDPLYLSWKARTLGFESRFIELASQLNASMPEHVVERTAKLLNQEGKSVKGSTILILGVAYKREVTDVRESPAIEIVQHLLGRGARVRYHDPFVPSFRANGGILRSSALTPALLRSADCVVIVTDHQAVDSRRVMKHARLILDTRNALKNLGHRSKKVFRL